MKTSMKIILAVVFVSLGLGGLAKTVEATQPQFLAAIRSQDSGIKVAEASDGDGETNDDFKESARLQTFAKITPQQAQQAVETAQKGKASSVKLENEEGNLVYAVTINRKEVKVDAGNGQILQVEGLNNEKDESAYPRSSIQIPQKGERK